MVHHATLIRALGLRPILVPNLGDEAVLVEDRSLLLLDDSVTDEAMERITDHLLRMALDSQ